MTKQEIEKLQHAIRETHGVASFHLETVPIKETFHGKTVWEGNVEVFAISGHSKAQQCYAWAFKRDDGRTDYVAVLQTPPVNSPLYAVRAYIVSQAKK